jgi:hypothetical protein
MQINNINPQPENKKINNQVEKPSNQNKPNQENQLNPADQRDLLSALFAAKEETVKPDLKLETAPTFDYRSHTRQETIQYILNSAVRHATASPVTGAAAEIIVQATEHHRINWNDVKKAAIRGGYTGAALQTLRDSYDTIRHNGR